MFFIDEFCREELNCAQKVKGVLEYSSNWKKNYGSLRLRQYPLYRPLESFGVEDQEPFPKVTVQMPLLFA